MEFTLEYDNHGYGTNKFIPIRTFHLIFNDEKLNDEEDMWDIFNDCMFLSKITINGKETDNYGRIFLWNRVSNLEELNEIPNDEFKEQSITKMKEYFENYYSTPS